MTEETSPTRFEARFASEDQPDWQPAWIARFTTAPDSPAPNLPGKNIGDLLVVAQKEGPGNVLLSLGKREKFVPQRALDFVRQASGALGRWLSKSGVEELAIDLDSLIAAAPEESVEGLAEAALVGVRLGGYRFLRYKKAEEPGRVTTIGLLRGGQPYVDTRLVEHVIAITDAVIACRDLAHEPANVINPVTLAERARQVAERYGLNLTVLDENQLAELGAGAILAVGKGSQTPPRLIVLEYAGQNGGQPVALVGKAITFDTGGYSIKSTEGIVGMKYDKSGGAAVLATMQAAAALRLKIPLVGVIAAAENMISGEAYRPDDIIRAMNGKTIEIVSTDAEGRLVLADALGYVQREYKPRAIIDLATLTGGVVVALGRVRAGLLSNDDMLAEALFQAGERSAERLWRMPLDDEYSKMMQGEDADLKNSGGREGHCILGGAFIKAFVDKGMPWAHLDIAGVADTPKETPLAPKGATGFGVRLLIEYLEGLG